MTPQRIQLSRRKGWRKPEGAIVVARGTYLGNPFRVYQHCKGPDGDWGIVDAGRFDLPLGHGWTQAGAHEAAVTCYRQALEKVFPERSSARASLVHTLRGHDLACWCPPSLACHVDVLLEIANGGGAG